MKETKLLHLDLQLFSDGGAAGGAAAAGNAGSTGEGATGDNSQSPTVSTGDNSQNPAEDRAALYKKFKTDFKSEFDAEVQGLMKNRLKNSHDELNAARKYREQADRILATIADKYGIDHTNLEALAAEVEKDNAYYEHLAMKNGTTPEQERRVRQVERENAYLKAKEDAEHQRAQHMQRVQALMQQEQDVKAFYPDFNFEAECEKNPTFRNLCLNGVNMRNAYEVTHMDEIMARSMQYAANQAAAKTQASIDANSRRPAENGLNSSQPADKTVDFSKMTLEDFQAYGERARKGEKVTFR